MIIAIDGPSASGKSTVARKTAEELGFIYVDSGSLYRGITWYTAAKKGLRDPDRSDVSALLVGMKMDFFIEGGAVLFTVDGHDPGTALRSAMIHESVSHIAAMPEVRATVKGWLRSMTRFGSLVMEGRDIGTAVFPEAEHKFYLDASPAERARRRLAQEHDSPSSMDSVRKSLERRDTIDSSRKADPLKDRKSVV